MIGYKYERLSTTFTTGAYGIRLKTHLDNKRTKMQKTKEFGSNVGWPVLE